MKLHDISIADLRKAVAIHDHRKRLLGLLAEDNYGLRSVGPFFDEGAAEAVAHAYRDWLLDQISNMTEQLVGMGLAVSDPEAPAGEAVDTTIWRRLRGSSKTFVVSRALDEALTARLDHVIASDETAAIAEVKADTATLAARIATLEASDIAVVKARIGEMERRFDTFVAVDAARFGGPAQTA